MVGWLLLAVALLIVAQLFRLNALLRGTYLILERHHRPPTENSDKWVNRLEHDLKDHYPDTKPALVYLLFGFAALAIALWAAWSFLRQ